ncbi:MAG: bifunctional hydroxymethylpyrimidine kinase/phosphomethylpyrimidine kinase [Oscillospiraceae bacterium]|jgi:pyridoxine kinase|nr:bifunctional hydroxymethylpyrimidine kinase/phosphomethylpyrimidine kinase [Oscillospiraceae bacterium]
MKKSPTAAVINDISGLGRCSLAAMLPVLAAIGVHACPVPIAVLTNQTGYDSYALQSCDEVLAAFPSQWKRQAVELNGISTGFFSSTRQVELARQFIRAMRMRDTLLLVDPVMGDNGHRYAGFDDALCKAIAELAQTADVLTPNLTEACMLCGVTYNPSANEASLRRLTAQLLSGSRAAVVVVTGVHANGEISNVLAMRDGYFGYFKSPCIGGSYSGTGDLFAAALFGYLLQGVDPCAAIPKIQAFLEAALRDANESKTRGADGVPFERHLAKLF